MFYFIKQNHLSPGNGVVKASYPSIDGITTNGFRVVEVPDEVSIDETAFSSTYDPANPNANTVLTYDKLIEQKYEKLAARRPSYSVHYYDLKDTSEFQLAGVSSNYLVGDGVYRIGGNGGTLLTLGTFLPDDYDEFLVYWDAYQIDRVRNGQRTEKRYIKVSPDVLDVSLFLNVQGFFEPVEFMKRFQSNNKDNVLLILLENNTPDPIYIGGLAFFYAKSKE